MENEAFAKHSVSRLYSLQYLDKDNFASVVETLNETLSHTSSIRK